jgi:hypothetical protein
VGADCKTSGAEVQRPGYLGTATSLAVVGSLAGLLAALLLGGGSGVGSFAADRPASPDRGLGLIFASGHRSQPGR